MLSLSSGFNYFLCNEPVTLRFRHSGLRNYIKSQLHRDPVNGDIYIFLSKDGHRVRLYYFHHQGEILTEKILHSNRFVKPVFDKAKCCYHISWESFVYLIEGIVLKDRRVAFTDIEDEICEKEATGAIESNVEENSKMAVNG